MQHAVRRLRPLAIGLVVLALSAGIALAARPSTSTHRSTTSAHVDSNVAGHEQNEATDTDKPDAAESGDAAADAGHHCATNPAALTTGQLAAANHGSIVCWAAHQATPNRYANHGAFVSEWARKNHGADATDGANSKAPVSSHASEHAGKGKANKP